MINYISGLAFSVSLLIGAAVGLLIELASPLWAIVFASIWLVGAIVAASSIKLAKSSEEAMPAKAARAGRIAAYQVLRHHLETA